MKQRSVVPLTHLGGNMCSVERGSYTGLAEGEARLLGSRAENAFREHWAQLALDKSADGLL